MGWIVGSLLIAYIAISLSFYFFHDLLVFQSRSLPPDYKFNFEQEFTEYSINTHDREHINALLFKTSQPSKGLILYFHGNADNLQRWGNYAVDFTQLGFDVLMTDYRGYGKSTGVPSEKYLYSDALTILRWAQENIKPEHTIFYGRSLGSAIASQLATVHNPDLLILETPFDELSGAIYPIIRPVLKFLPQRYYFSNKASLTHVTCRKVIFHGTNDWIVPLSSALRLKPLLHEDDKFIIINGGGHRNLRDFKEFHRVLAEELVL
jgi:pimeloyl-ACP methyl ester carboxylesterase